MAVGYALLQDSPSGDSGQEATAVTAAAGATSTPAAGASPDGRQPDAAEPGGDTGALGGTGADGGLGLSPQDPGAGDGAIAGNAGDPAALAPGAQPGEGATGQAQPPGPDATTTGAVVAEPTSGGPGESITVRADRDAVPGRTYQLKLAREAEGCPRGTQIGGPTAAGPAGDIPPTPGVIPENLTSGTYFVCFAASADASEATATATFTVI